jgi:hypothetical protein
MGFYDEDGILNDLKWRDISAIEDPGKSSTVVGSVTIAGIFHFEITYLFECIRTLRFINRGRAFPDDYSHLSEAQSLHFTACTVSTDHKF